MHVRKGSAMNAIQVGVGVHGLRWVHWLKQTPGIRVVAMVDVDRRALDTAAREGGYRPDRCYTSLQQALRKHPADALVCVTPPSYHLATIGAALKQGMHVISEKPMADSLASCRKILRQLDRSGKRCVISQNFRYRPAMYTLADAVRKGVIGKIGQVKIDFYLGFDFGGGFRHEMKHPVIVDMAVHHFDLVRFITGLDAISVAGMSWNPHWSNYAGDCSSNVVFEMENGAHAVYNASWCAKGQYSDWNGNWLIEGDNGALEYRNGVITLHKTPGLYTVKQTRPVPIRRMKYEEQLYILREFKNALAQNREPECSAWDNIRSIAMVYAAVKALDCGRKIPVIDAVTERMLHSS
ncbi:MAG: hypothetical protein GF398_12215 [Chitinivibrionales bacterium]|nr:hypothetical protein [Chitinivibrionales bacterium]